MISNELFKKILGNDVLDVRVIKTENSVVYYEYDLEHDYNSSPRTKSDNITLDKLAKKCKEWSNSDSIWIYSTSVDSLIGAGKRRKEGIAFAYLDEEYSNNGKKEFLYTSTKPTEVEAILDVGEWLVQYRPILIDRMIKEGKL
jgi:hypothetical protein